MFVSLRLIQRMQQYLFVLMFLFYKDKLEDARMYNWLDSQTSIVNSISFALYLFIRLFGIGDTITIISNMMFDHKDIFMEKLNSTTKKESVSE